MFAALASWLDLEEWRWLRALLAQRLGRQGQACEFVPELVRTVMLAAPRRAGLHVKLTSPGS